MPHSSPDDPVASVVTALRAQHRTYVEELRQDGLDPLRETLSTLADAHERAAAPLHDGSPDTRKDLWRAVRTYRQDATDAVWRPLRERLDALDLGTLLRDQRAQLRDAQAALADDLPEPEAPPGQSEEGGLPALDRRLGAVGARFWPSEEGGPPPGSWRALAVRRIRGPLRAAQAEALDSAEQTIVQWAARLERTAVAWTHRLLECDRLLDRPAFHAPADSEVPAPADDPTEGVAEPDLDTLRSEVHEQMRALQACLEAGQALDLDATVEGLDAALDTTATRLRADRERAGRLSTLFRVDWSALTPSSEATAEAWPDWFDEVEGRLDFLYALTRLRDGTVRLHEALIDDLSAASLRPVRDALTGGARHLDALADDLDGMIGTPDAGDELDLLQAVDHRAETGLAALEDDLRAPIRDTPVRRDAQSVVEARIEALASLVDAQPEGFVLHPLPPSGEPVDPEQGRPLPWREAVANVFDELLFDDWRAALTSVLEALGTAASQAHEVQTIVQFHLGAAREELQDLRDARQRNEGDHAHVPDARELALDGVDRGRQGLLAARDALDEATGALTRRTWIATTTAWTELHDHARAAGLARAHALRLQGQLERGVHWLAVETRRQARAATTQVRRTVHRARRQAQHLFRLGRAAVGTEPVDEAALRETAEVLASIDAVLAELPLVYRRLFTFRPVQDLDLLVGREADRAAVERHMERWRGGLTEALVLTAPPGSGRTSFLNALRGTTLRSAQRHTLDLTGRVSDEADFAGKVVQALRLPLRPGPDLTLDAVAEHLRAHSTPERERVCTIEHLEHTLLRTVGGTDLTARVLHFLAETDPHVLWIATMGKAAWQVLSAGEPAATRLVARHSLAPLGRDEMEEVVMRRHRRSGLGLRFEPPDASAAPLLTRRLRGTTDEARQQELLRSEFFDGLHQACGPNVMLALFHWFRAVSLDEDAATLRVRPLQPLTFGALDALPLPHAFALKALLEHATLTIAELAEVMGTDPATSRALLEALGNALLVTAAHEPEGVGPRRFASVERGVRYRVRPLLVHPVTQFLRSRNIMHGAPA